MKIIDLMKEAGLILVSGNPLSSISFEAGLIVETKDNLGHTCRIWLKDDQGTVEKVESDYDAKQAFAPHLLGPSTITLSR